MTRTLTIRRERPLLAHLMLAAAVVLATVLVAMPTAGATHHDLDSIAEIATDAGDFEILLGLLEATGLDAAVADPDASLTVFAPTDAAFAELLANPDVAAAVEDVDFLTSVLLYHVVPGDFQAFQLAEHDSWTTLNGASLTIDGDEGTVDGANIVVDGLSASNGVIHVIDQVLIPS